MNGTERRLGVLRPFAIRDFRLLWTGMTVSLIGDGIFIVAMAWQVYELSNSPTALALVGLAWTAPMVVFLLLGGVIADRFDRRRVMILSDVIRAVAVGAMGALAVTGSLELWHLYALAALYGAGDALFPPAFGATVPHLVPQHLLVQANSVDGLVRPFAMQLVGPAVGGLLVDAVGVGTVFLLDAGTFVISMTMLALMRPVSPGPRTGPPAGILSDIREGFAFVRSEVWLWGTLLAAALFLLVWLGPFEVLLPYVVKNEIGGSARDLGLVFAAAGLGAILAAHRDGATGAATEDDHLHVRRLGARRHRADRLRAGELALADARHRARRRRRRGSGSDRVAHPPAAERASEPARTRHEPRLDDRDQPHADLVRADGPDRGSAGRAGDARRRRRARRSLHARLPLPSRHARPRAPPRTEPEAG